MLLAMPKGDVMKKIEVIIKPFKLDEVKDGLAVLGMSRLTISIEVPNMRLISSPKSR